MSVLARSTTAVRTVATPGIDYLEPAYWIDGYALAGAIIWPAVIMAIFLPLAVRQFKSLSR